MYQDADTPALPCFNGVTQPDGSEYEPTRLALASTIYLLNFMVIISMLTPGSGLISSMQSIMQRS